MQLRRGIGETSDRDVRRAGAGEARLNLAIDTTLRGRERLRFSPDDLVSGAADRARLPPHRTCPR